MPVRTTWAGLAPRLFTLKFTAQPRTPDSYGVLRDPRALGGIWIGPLIHLGRESGNPGAATQQNSERNKARPAVSGGAFWRRCSAIFSVKFGDERTWA